MRTRHLLYVHGNELSSVGSELLKERLTNSQVIDVVIDINDYEGTTSKIEDVLNSFNPDVVISDGLAAFFVHTLCGYNRICVNAKIHPSLRCDESLRERYIEMEKNQLWYDRSQDFDESTHCWGVFGLDVERRDFAMLYYPNVTTIPRVVKSIADALDESIAIINMIGESNRIDDYGVHFAEYGRILVKTDYALFRGVEKYSVPDGVVVIDAGAFCGTNIKSVSIPESVSYIGKYAFRDCNQLKEIVLPSKVSVIQTGCFLGCNALKEVVLPKSLNTIKNKAFWDTGLEMVEVPDNIMTIEDKAFNPKVKLIVSLPKFTEVLHDAKEYRLSQADEDI